MKLEIVFEIFNIVDQMRDLEKTLKKLIMEEEVIGVIFGMTQDHDVSNYLKKRKMIDFYK